MIISKYQDIMDIIMVTLEYQNIMIISKHHNNIKIAKYMIF